MSNDHDINTTSVSVSVAIGDVKNLNSIDLRDRLTICYCIYIEANSYSRSCQENFPKLFSYRIDRVFCCFIKITAEGPRIILDPGETGIKKVSDKQMVALQLVASRIVKDLGKTEIDGMSLSQIQFATTLNPKSVSSRLSELVKSGHVLRNNTKDGVDTMLFTITTSGIHWLKSALSKKSS